MLIFDLYFVVCVCVCVCACACVYVCMHVCKLCVSEREREREREKEREREREKEREPVQVDLLSTESKLITYFYHSYILIMSTRLYCGLIDHRIRTHAIIVFSMQQTYIRSILVSFLHFPLFLLMHENTKEHGQDILIDGHFGCLTTEYATKTYFSHFP